MPGVGTMARTASTPGGRPTMPRARIILLVVSAALVASAALAGCGPIGGKSAGTGSGSGGPVVAGKPVLYEFSSDG